MNISGNANLPPHLRGEKQKIRNSLRQEYWKKMSEPHNNVLSKGEVLFDSAHQRYVAAHATKVHYFRPTYWNGFLFIAILVAPITLTTYLFKWDREKREKALRSGEVAYKDRIYKFK